MPATMSLTLLQMPYTDASGDAHPNSVWLPAQVTQNVIDQSGSVLWYGYRDAAAFVGRLAPVGQHATQVGQAAFVTGSQMPPQGATQAQNTVGLAIGFALSVADTPVLDASGKPSVDAQGKPVMQPFFQGATTTTVSVPVGP